MDNLTATAFLAERLRALELPEPVVVAPDVGFAKSARGYAKILGTELAIADKERLAHDEHAHVRSVIGTVAGRSAIVVDDFTVSAGTLTSVAEELVSLGARRVVAAVTHGVLTGTALARLEASPIERLFITDTVENQPVALTPKVEVVSVAALLGEAIHRIHHRESISAMFVG